MADRITLLQALQSGLTQAQETPSGIGAGVIGSAIPSLQNPYASTSSNLGHTLGASLLGGLLAGYARSQAQSENAQLIPQMSAVMNASSPEERMALAGGNPRLSPLIQALSMEDFESKRKIQDQINSKAIDYQYNPQIKAAEQQALIPLENQQRIDQGVSDLAMQQGYVVDNGKLVPVDGVGLKSPMDMEAEAEAKKVAARLQAERAAMGNRVDLTPTQVQELTKSKVVIDEANVIASKLDSSGKSWTDLQTQKAFSGADKDGIAQALKNLADRFARARTGAAMNNAETKLYNELVSGDLTAEPAQVANLLRKLAEAESRAAQSQVGFAYTAQRGDRDAILDSFKTETPPEISANDALAELRRRGILQ